MITLAILAILVLYVIITYNKFIKTKNNIYYSISSVDVMLKKRHDLIPNLVNIVKGYKNYEKELLTKITELRTALKPDISLLDEHSDYETKYQEFLTKFIAIAENYPQLKAGENFLHLQKTLNEVEEQISAGRRAFNANVTQFNNLVETFPSSIIADMFNFEKLDWFSIKEIEKQVIKVSFDNEWKRIWHYQIPWRRNT